MNLLLLSGVSVHAQYRLITDLYMYVLHVHNNTAETPCSFRKHNNSCRHFTDAVSVTWTGVLMYSLHNQLRLLKSRCSVIQSGRQAMGVYFAAACMARMLLSHSPAFLPLSASIRDYCHHFKVCCTCKCAMYILKEGLYHQKSGAMCMDVAVCIIYGNSTDCIAS